MNECLTTPHHKKQIGYWVSEKGKGMKWLGNEGRKKIFYLMILSTHFREGNEENS